ncbi:MAG: HAD family hydrolase [Halobacteriales archaeon]
MTTAICFDLDGTLVQLDRPYEAVLADVFERHVGETAPALTEAYDEAFFEAFRNLDPEPYRRGMAAALEAADEAGIDADADPGAMVETLRTAEYEAGTVPSAARESLAELDEAAALALVTDGLPDWQRGKLDHHGLADRFDAVVTSYEAGAHKPDRAPFDLARERVPADEYAMVGDDYEADVEGARAAGFVPVHYEDGDGPDFWATLRALA